MARHHTAGGMLGSVRSTARCGHKGCRCCYPAPSARVLRSREKRAWKKEQA